MAQCPRAAEHPCRKLPCQHPQSHPHAAFPDLPIRGIVNNLQSRKRKEGGSRKSQIWTLCSGWGADRRAAWFAVRDTRGAENVVEILGDAGRRLEYLVSDGYSGYGSGLEELERRFGIRIKSARCLTHARRPLHRFLDSCWELHF